MRLSNNAKRVLVGILRRMAEIEALPGPGPDDYLTKEGRLASSRLRTLKADVPKIGVPLRIADFADHPPSPSESASYSRLLRTMAKARLVKLNGWAGSRQATHVALTRAGQQLAEKLEAADDG